MENEIDCLNVDEVNLIVNVVDKNWLLAAKGEREKSAVASRKGKAKRERAKSPIKSRLNCPLTRKLFFAFLFRHTTPRF